MGEADDTAPAHQAKYAAGDLYGNYYSPRLRSLLWQHSLGATEHYDPPRDGYSCGNYPGTRGGGHHWWYLGPFDLDSGLCGTIESACPVGIYKSLGGDLPADHDRGGCRVTLSLAAILAAAAGAITNTGLVLGMIYLFYQTPAVAHAYGVDVNHLLSALEAIMATNGLAELILAVIVVPLIALPVLEVQRRLGQ